MYTYILIWCDFLHGCIHVYIYECIRADFCHQLCACMCKYTWYNECIYMNLYVCMYVRVDFCPWIRACMCTYTWYCIREYDTGWRRHIGCLKLLVMFRKRATNYRALLRKLTYKDKASYDPTPPCMILCVYCVCFCPHTAVFIYVGMRL